MYEVQVYTVGLVHASACAPADMPVEQVTEQVNLISPTGIESRWEPSPDKTFSGGQPNPCTCEKDPTRKHWLFVC